MEQASLLDGSSYDALAFKQDGLASAEVDIGRREIVDVLVIAAVIVMLDEGLDVGWRTMP